MISRRRTSILVSFFKNISSLSCEKRKADVAFIALLKDCAVKKDVGKGTKIHMDIVKSGLLETSPYLASSLISMYSKCGVFNKAFQVLEELPNRNVIAWNALITGYVNKGQGHEALNCFESMQSEGVSPDAVTFLCILRACGSIRAIEKGKQIHHEIVNRGLLTDDIMLGNALIDMYAKCGMLHKARKVLDELPSRDVVSWSALITGYAQQGKGDEALECFEFMQREGHSPDAVTFICILKACGSKRNAHRGKQIHNDILRKGLLKKDMVLGTALVDMYVKCGILSKARKVLEELPVRNVISWSALIAGYAEQDQCHEALDCFEQMRSEGICPNVVTFICILKSCGKIRAIDKGKRIHEEIMSRGLLEKDVVLGNALVDMYAKCGMLIKAQQVLEELHIRNVVAWNALISVYAEEGKGEEVLSCYDRMQSEGVSPDTVTYICVLKACAKTGAIDKGKEIHKEIVKLGLLEKDITLSTALVNMYAKCGMLSMAQQTLENLPDRHVVSWSALIAGYIDQGQGHEALNFFEKMQHENLSPDSVTFICLLKACGSTGAIEKGKKIHDEIVSQGLLDKDIALGTTLVDMYARCGVLEKAQQVLEELPVRNLVSWSALIAGYAQQGQGYKALDCFKRMQMEGHSPDEVTFLCVLSACYHSGLLDEAEQLFGIMSREYGITSSIEHLTCMVMVFGSGGNFDEALSIIKAMSLSEFPTIWVALLGACRKWGNVKLGILAFDQTVQLDDSCAAAYVLMANIFAAAGMQEDAEKVESMRQKYAGWKNQLNSVWVDETGNAHSFSIRDTKHSRSKEIYAKVREILHKMSQEGYSMTVQWVSENILDTGKHYGHCGHSVWLAIACALIHTQEGETIHVMDKACVCGNCYFATSIMSKIEKRKIMVRDLNNLHIFEPGKCITGTVR